MILQGILRIEYKNNSYQLMVKTFLKDGVYYFFVSDKERERPLLKGITLELIYITSFNTTSEDLLDKDQNIPAELVNAIENMLLENMPSWYYSKQNLNSHL